MTNQRNLTKQLKNTIDTVVNASRTGKIDVIQGLHVACGYEGEMKKVPGWSTGLWKPGYEMYVCGQCYSPQIDFVVINAYYTKLFKEKYEHDNG